MSESTSPAELAEQTGLPPSPVGLSRDEFDQMSRRMGRLNHGYVREAQAAGQTEVVQLEYGRNDEGEMVLATKVAPVAPLAQRIREADEWGARERMAKVADHRPVPDAMRRPQPRASRGKPIHRRGSRRTGTGSRAPPSDDPHLDRPLLGGGRR
jgi:hypothetical protein